MASTSQALPPTLPSLSTPKDARVTLPFSGSLYPSLGQPVLFWCSLTGPLLWSWPSCGWGLGPKKVGLWGDKWTGTRCRRLNGSRRNPKGNCPASLE